MQFLGFSLALETDSADGFADDSRIQQCLMHAGRDQDLAGTAALGDPSSEVDGIAEEIVTLAKAGAAVDSCPDAQALGLDDVLVLIGQLLLNCDSRADRQCRFGKLGHDRVTDCLDDRSTEHFDRSRHQIVVSMEEKEPGRIAESIEVGSGANDVREEDRHSRFMPPKLLIDFGSSLKELVDVVHVKVHLYNHLSHPMGCSLIR